jgi:hypothetical protein
VRGYHVYKDIWDAAEGEVLLCSRELHNLRDPFAVAIIKNDITVGHVPRMISATCSSFLRRSGTITCRIIGERRYSRDLPQGGLEIPCILTFSGDANLIEKAKKLLETQVMTKNTEVNGENESKSPKRSKVEPESPASILWVSVQGLRLTISDKQIVMNGLELTDMHINVAQGLLHKQFPLITGLCSSLSPILSIGNWIKNYLQIFHCYGNHWICASTIGCEEGIVNIYDSLYSSVSGTTQSSIDRIFSLTDIIYIVPSIKKQNGAKDCGLFAIAVSTYLAFGRDPNAITSHHFEQSRLRSHLLSCIQQNYMSEFP